MAANYSKPEAREFYMFKGLCPVRVPASWTKPAENIRWHTRDAMQFVDFTANGGRAYAFWIGVEKPHPGAVPHYDSQVAPSYELVDHPEWMDGWGPAGPETAFYVESYDQARIFGVSANFIDLVPPAPHPEGEPYVYPPAQLAGYAMDTTTPMQYASSPDNFGGCGNAYCIARRADGKALDRWDGMGATNWAPPLCYKEYTFEAYVAHFKNATTIRPIGWMVIDNVDPQELLAAFQRRDDYEGYVELSKEYAERFVPEGMRFESAYLVEGPQIVITCTKPVDAETQLRRQVAGYAYLPVSRVIANTRNRPVSSTRVAVPQNRFIRDWVEVYFVIFELGQEPEVRLMGESLWEGNQWENLPERNRQRVAELDAKA